MVWFLVRTVLDTHNTPPAPAAHEADRRHPTSDMATNQCKITATAESYYGLNRNNYTYSHTLNFISKLECFQFLRHCATCHEVAGSIPDGLIAIFHWQCFRPHCDPAVVSASDRNEYQEYFLGVKFAAAYDWQPYHPHVSIVLKSGSLRLLEISRPLDTCNGIASIGRLFCWT